MKERPENEKPATIGELMAESTHVPAEPFTRADLEKIRAAMQSSADGIVISNFWTSTNSPRKAFDLIQIEGLDLNKLPDEHVQARFYRINGSLRQAKLPYRLVITKEVPAGGRWGESLIQFGVVEE